MMNFCECESAACHHYGAPCKKRRRLALCRVVNVRQTLCPECAEVAQDFCDSYGYRFDVLTEAGPRREWRMTDWLSVGVLVLVVAWMAIEILPAFLDGRIAQAVGR